ncbi:MAG: hypothetical protein JJE30_04040 [Desulfuromonadales bacterium]|nr:hypothetical protein [Desulfuromonadales bacterium]
MWPFNVIPRHSRIREGFRIVHNLPVKRNAHYAVNAFPNMNNVLTFVVADMRFCITPKYYNEPLQSPSPAVIKKYQSKYKININAAILGSLIDVFNAAKPVDLLKQLIRKQIVTLENTSNEAMLSGSLYLNTYQEMRRCSLNGHAYRINTLRTLFYENMINREVKDKDLSENFWIFSQYVKDTYCGGRSYESK